MARLTAVVPKVCRKPWPMSLHRRAKLTCHRRQSNHSSRLFARFARLAFVHAIASCFFDRARTPPPLSLSESAGLARTGGEQKCQSCGGQSSRITGQDHRTAGGVVNGWGRQRMFDEAGGGRRWPAKVSKNPRPRPRENSKPRQPRQCFRRPGHG